MSNFNNMTPFKPRTASATSPGVRRLLLTTWLILLIAAAGCQRASQQTAIDQAPELVATLAISPEPAIVGPASLELRLTDASGAALPGARVALKGDMSHAGMQPLLADAAETTGGIYQAQWTWSMAGDWLVTATAALPDGRTLVRRFDLTVARP
ncbi:MAG: FixH family protein [Anaerolineae bacterium]